MLSFLNTNDINNLIELEEVSLMSDLDIQKSFNKQVLVLMKKLMANIDFSVPLNANDKNFFYLNQSTDALNKTNININILNNLLEKLSHLKNTNNISDELLNLYNSEYQSGMSSIYENTEKIENFIHEYNICKLPDIKIIESANAPKVIEDSKFKENTLIISVDQGKVIFPYKIEELENTLQNNKRYHSIEEIIDRFYTKPIGYYKFSAISRFKEAYKLIKDKEKGSTFKALVLAFELFGNYSLHPAIITACKSLDALDIYLACLDENTLDDFKFFNIKYEIPLTIKK